MCDFFSAVVTPQGIFFAEDWSHETVRRRLGIEEDCVDIEYDDVRGFECHEPFRLPAWFDREIIMQRARALHGELKPLYEKYEADRKQLYEKYEADLKPLYEKYEADRKPLDEKYEADRKQLYEKYQADLKRVEGYVPKK